MRVAVWTAYAVYIIICVCGDVQGKSAKRRQKVIIDTDPGTDDAQALIMMLEAHYKSDIEIIACTTVTGNTVLDNVNRNLLRTLEATNSLSEFPIIYGANTQLVQDFVAEEPPYYGKDGFGDVEFNGIPPTFGNFKARHASLELVDIVHQFPGEVILLAIGPLTNIAISMTLDPQFTSKLKDFYIMGGNLTDIENANLSVAEFNFFADPEAAKIVLDRTQIPIKLVPLETSFDYAALPYADRRSLGSAGTAVAKFLNKVEAKVIRDAFYPKWLACDQVASAWLLDTLKPESEQTLQVQTEEILATVQIGGSDTRGMMVRLEYVDRPNNIIAMTTMNTEAFRKYLEDTFSAVF